MQCWRVEASGKALRAAEEALTAAKIASNQQAKNTLKAVTEAFVLEIRILGVM